MSDPPIPGEQEMNARILSCAEELKDQTLARRVASIVCSPIYADRRVIIENHGADLVTRVKNEIDRQRAALGQVSSEVSSIIEKVKSSYRTSVDRSKVDLVPGAALLDSVCHQFRLRFAKERDSACLASHFLQHEVSVEIRQLLDAIGARSL